MNNLPLARLLRPKNFREVHGHESIKEALKKLLFPLKHHTFLLTGSRGLGKTSIGRLIAQAVLCPYSIDHQDPCGICDICQRIQLNQHPDVVEIDGASKTKVEEVRDIIASSFTLPLEGRYKVYLIDEVHMLSTHSFNALLKNLEEPPPHVIFVLATTEFHKIPSTIRSRCLIFQLLAPPVAVLIDFLKKYCELQKIPYEIDALAAIAEQADGSYRDMLNILEYSLALTSNDLKDNQLFMIFSILSHQDLSEITESLALGNSESLKELFKKYLEKGLSADRILRQLMVWIAEHEDITQPVYLQIYQELSKASQLMVSHPYPNAFLQVSLLRIALLVGLKKKVTIPSQVI